MNFSLDLLTCTESFEENLSGVINRLKTQKVLPQHSFINALPFFNFAILPKESHIKDLFLNTYDPNLFRLFLQNITESSVSDGPETPSNSLARLRVMNFAQIVLYKVLPCPDKDCQKCPREIVTHNEYKDFEYECPFYHHERDRRRMVITSGTDEEFVYKANYYEEGRSYGDKDKFSQNYFESMFHPLYYKMFRCKRGHCNSSHFCPFFHKEEERSTWNIFFSEFMQKDRGTYVKDKQKYYEGNSQGLEVKQHKGEHVDSSNKRHYNENYAQKNYNSRRGGNYPQHSNHMYQLSYETKNEKTTFTDREWKELRKESIRT